MNQKKWMILLLILFGHWLGTVYAVSVATLGAVLSFLTTR